MYIMEDNLLYLKSTDFRCNSDPQNIFIAMSRLVLDQTTRNHSLTKLT